MTQVFFIPSYYEGHSLTRNFKLETRNCIWNVQFQGLTPEFLQMNQMNQMNQMKRQSKDLTLEVVDG